MAYLRRLPSGKYQATVRLPSGKRSTITRHTKAAASKWAETIERQLEEGTVKDPRAGRITVGEWTSRWLAARVAARTTLTRNETVLALHVLPRWEHVRLDQLSRLEIQGWVKRLSADGVGAPTVKAAHQLFVAVLRAAVLEGIIPANPAIGVDLPKQDQRAERFLSHEEWHQLAAHIPQAWLPMATVAVWTGLRWGELAGLHAERVDMLRRQLTVVEVAEETSGGIQIRAYPKTHSSQRVIPLPDPAIDALAQALTGIRTGLIWTNARGKPHSRANVRQRIWVQAVADAKLRDPAPRWHDLRHTYASWCIDAGLSLRQVQGLLGHSSITVTERYSHLMPDNSEKVTSALNGSFVRASLMRQTGGPT